MTKGELTLDAVAPRTLDLLVRNMAGLAAEMWLADPSLSLRELATRLAPVDLLLREGIHHNAIVLLHDLRAAPTPSTCGREVNTHDC